MDKIIIQKKNIYYTTVTSNGHHTAGQEKTKNKATEGSEEIETGV